MSNLPTSIVPKLRKVKHVFPPQAMLAMMLSQENLKEVIVM